MYPAQTSLIPIQIALSRFLEASGLSAFVSNYPYWYLGTTPFRYLSGPILPSVLALLHRLLPSLSLFEIMLGLIGVVWVIGGVGVFLLAQALMSADQNAERRRIPALVAFFYLLGPIVPFLFRFSDGLYLIAFSFLPFALLLYLRLLKTWSRRLTIFTVLMISFVILLDSLIIPTLVLGMAAIFLAQVGWKKMEEKLKQTILLFTFSILLSTFWYTPGYWLTLLGAPSFGGKGLAGVVVWLGKLLPVALAFVFAIVSVKFFKKREPLRDFCFYWLFVFGFLTLIRFLSDPDFWLDWISYSTELQLGLAVLGGLVVNRWFVMRIQANDKRIYANERMIPFVVCCLLFVVWMIVFNKYVLVPLQKDITATVEYRIGSQLSQTASRGERVFLSGTTVFWLNAFFDVPQVRGGRDQASTDQSWRRVVWEIREGATAEGTGKALRSLNVSYLVVHTEESEEFYHDFKYPGKFEGAPGLVKIFDEQGDRIYRVKD